MVVVNEWTGVARTPTGGSMIISFSLTGWPIGFLISAGNPTPPIFTVPSFAGRPMGLPICASLAGPSYQVPPSLAGQWLLFCASLAGHLRQSLPCWLADDCSPMHYWLAHSDQSHPYQLASSCSACASLAAWLCLAGWPIISSPSLASWPVAAWLVLHWLAHLHHSLPCWLADGCSPVLHWLAVFVSPSLAGWPMTARLCIIGWPIVTSPTLPAGQWLLSLCLTGWQMRLLACVSLLAHGNQSHPCQLANGCLACASLAGPLYRVPPSPAGR